MSIKAVVFDFGQVISLPQDPKALDELSKRAGVKRESFESLYWSLRGEYDRGTLTPRDYYKKILSGLRVNKSDEEIDEMVEIDFNSWKNINPGTVTLMEDIKNAGLLLGILSNLPHYFLDWARKNIPAFSLPQVGVFSCEVDAIKPEEAIYRKLLSLLGTQGEETVFFDDLPANVKGAADLGIKAILWKDPESARRELVALGLDL